MFKPLKRLRDRGSARDSHNLLTFATVSRGALIAPHAHVTHELNNPQKGEAVRRRLQDKTTPLTLFAKTVTSDAIMSIMDMNSLHLCTGKRDDVPITENVMLSLRLRSRSLPRWYCSSSPRARAQMPFASSHPPPTCRSRSSAAAVDVKGTPRSLALVPYSSEKALLARTQRNGGKSSCG